MSKYKVVMRCAVPVMDANGVQIHKPGDLLPEGDPAIDDSPLSWAPHIISAVEAPDVAPPAIVDVSDPHPESTVRTADEAVESEVPKPVDF